MIINDKNVFAIIKKWCVEEKVFKNKLPAKNGFDWAMQLSYPFDNPQAMSIVICNPAGTDFIMLQINVKIALIQADALKQKRCTKRFWYQLQETFLEHDVVYEVAGMDGTFMVARPIFYDGLTKDHFFETIRAIHDAAMLGNLLLSEIIDSMEDE